MNDMNQNRLSVTPGCIMLNGSKVNCVTDFKYECVGGGIANVKMAFDISAKNAEITSEPEPVYKRIRISFLKAGSIVIEENDWDDYEIYNGFLVVKKGEAWIAMYNMKEIFSVVLEK